MNEDQEAEIKPLAERTCSLSVVSCSRADNKEGDADAGVEGCKQSQESISFLRIVSGAPSSSMMFVSIYLVQCNFQN